MKKYLLYSLFALFSITSVNAQDGGMQDNPKREQKIQALYVAYITQELKLTESEAQRFWPVHTQFDQEIKSLRMDMPELDRQQAALNIKKKYQERFTSILGAGRTDSFFRMDGEFRKKMIERLKQMRQNGDRPMLRRNNLRP